MQGILLNFSKKIFAIQKAENISAITLGKTVGIASHHIYEYRTDKVKNPAIPNINKFLKAYPQYTYYILGINPETLPKQIILDDE